MKGARKKRKLKTINFVYMFSEMIVFFIFKKYLQWQGLAQLQKQDEVK